MGDQRFDAFHRIVSSQLLLPFLLAHPLISPSRPSLQVNPVTKFEVAALGDSNMRTLQKGDVIQLERKVSLKKLINPTLLSQFSAQEHASYLGGHTCCFQL